MSAKPMCIRFDKMDGFTRVYAGTRCLVLFGGEKHDSISNMIRYLVGVISGITYVIFHNYAKIQIDSYDFLSLEKTLTLHDVPTLIKSVWIKMNYLIMKFL